MGSYDQEPRCHAMNLSMKRDRTKKTSDKTRRIDAKKMSFATHDRRAIAKTKYSRPVKDSRPVLRMCGEHYDPRQVCYGLATTMNTSSSLISQQDSCCSSKTKTGIKTVATGTTHLMRGVAATVHRDSHTRDNEDGYSNRQPYDVAHDWVTIIDTNVPCITRHGERYISMEMTNKLLSRFPAEYHELISQQPTVENVQFTDADARMPYRKAGYSLHERDISHGDPMIRVTDFNAFLERLLLKIHLINVLKRGASDTEALPPGLVSGGFIQINDMLVPYVWRDLVRYIPLHVVRMALGQTTQQVVADVHLIAAECAYLNQCCDELKLSVRLCVNDQAVSIDSLCK